MGKGRGDDEKKSWFHNFIEDSYFSYQFLNWSIAFFVIGILFIIGGIIADEVYPKQQYKKVVASELLDGSTSSDTYTRWQAISERLYFWFNNVNTSITDDVVCNEVGPYIFDVKLNKINVEFQGLFVQYNVLPAKTFLTTSSVPSQIITNFNAKYVQAEKTAGNEPQLIYDAIHDAGIDVAIYNLFKKNTTAALLGSYGVAQQFSNTEKHILECEVYPNFFGTEIQQGIDTYGTSYLIDVSTQLCNFKSQVSFIGSTKGIDGATFGRYFNQSNACGCNIINQKSADNDCQGSDVCGSSPPSKTNGCFFSNFVDDFSLFTNETFTDCMSDLVSLTFNSSDPFTAPQACAVVSALGTLSDFIDDTAGPKYCSGGLTALNLASGMLTPCTTLGTTGISADQLDYICNEYIYGTWLDFLERKYPFPAGVNLNNVGKYRFCVGATGLAPGAPAISLPNIPSEVKSWITPPDFSLGLATYDETLCTQMIDALSNVTGFVIPVRNDPTTIPDDYESFSNETMTTLINFMDSFEGLYQYWVADYLQKSAATPICLNCWNGISAFDSTLFASPRPPPEEKSHNGLDGLTRLLYPITSTDMTYALTNPLPKPINVNGFFGDITDAQGLLFYYEGIWENFPFYPAGPFGVDNATLQILEGYVQDMVNTYLCLKYSTFSDIGPDYFGCGDTNDILPWTCGDSGTEKCSISELFYDYAVDYFPEYCLAATRGPFGYLHSFTVGAHCLNSTTDGNNILGDLINSDVILGALGGTRKLYMNYLISTYGFQGLNGQERPASLNSLPDYSGSNFLAQKLAVDWIGIGGGDNTDMFASLENVADPTFAIDPNTQSVLYSIQTGANDQSKAFLFSQVSGGSSINNYGQPVTVAGLNNFDHFPPNVASKGAKVSVFDTFLNRPFDFEFDGTATIDDIDGVTGHLSGDPFAVDPTYSITTEGLMPVAYLDNIVVDYWAPCDATLDNVKCPFPQNATADTDEINVIEDTGRVLQVHSCLVRVFGGPNFDNSQFPIGDLNIAIPNKMVMPIAKRIRDRTIVEKDAQAFTEKNKGIKNTAKTMLIAFVVVGCVFIVAGCIFVGFYFYKRYRDDKKAAGMELVADPFKESNDRFAVIR